MANARMKQLAASLRAGAGADIWYDADSYDGDSYDGDGDAEASTLIADTQAAMEEAAALLERLAAEGDASADTPVI